MTSGETDLGTLMASMAPTLDPAVYVFVTSPRPLEVLDNVALMRFSEAEGVTYIITQADALSHGVDHAFPCRRITLNVHSALDAVGFIAAVATRLAAAGMGVNPVAGYFHDHLFVPADRVDDAMAALTQLVAEHQSASG